MDTVQFIAQSVGIVAMGFNILSFQRKSRGGVIAFQLLGSLLFSVNFLLLGATMGCILNIISAIRAVIFLNREKLNANHPAWLTGFFLTYLISYGLTFTLLGTEQSLKNLIVEFLPVIGMTVTTISFRRNDAGAIRRLGLISSPCWLIYNIAAFSLGAIICEVLSLGSILLGIRRLDREA